MAAATFLGVGSVKDRAEAYLFYDNGAFDYIVPASEAIRWAADAWGPGRTLVWEIEDGPDWPLLLDHSAEGFGAYVEEALSSWSGIPTADISWRLSGVVEPSEASRFGDSRNRVFFSVDDRISGSAAWWVRNHDLQVWEITECDVGIPPDWLEVGLEADDLRGWATAFLRWEVGHCLGLHQPAEFPASQGLRSSTAENDDAWYSTAVWRPGSVMNWGGNSPSPDDQAGASLLRPRAGWLSSRGSVAGSLESDRGLVPYAHVYALRRTPDGMRDPVGAFANARGEFLIEGLPAGDYVLWAHPIRDHGRYRPRLLEDAETDVKDAVLAHPVSVKAGQGTDGIKIPMQRRRE